MNQPLPKSSPHLLLGVCDYPEHVPADRFKPYAKMQHDLGLHYVRIGEFAWSRMEPQPGKFSWNWLDEALESSLQQNINVVLCTPTATPPAWLIRQHPEILAVDANGKVREFGSRRHYDFASSVYKDQARRITQTLALRYGRHAAVVGWQIDNEFGCHDTARSYGGASAEAFPKWLAKKYRSVEVLNKAWGNVFWSMEYSNFEQIKPPSLTVTEPNPSHVLDYQRFCSEMVTEFQAQQVDILRELSPYRFITHNFMIFESGFDHYKVAEKLDFVSWDNYPTGMLEALAPVGSGEHMKTYYARTGHPDLVAFNHDLYRGLLANRPDKTMGREGKDTPNGFWVMEQQCGQVNWAAYNPLPAVGAVRLWTAQAWAHGADVVAYFRWRAATMAQEVMHSGLLRHDETPDRGFNEVKSLDLAAFPIGAVPAKVAVLHDYESLWIYDQQKHNASMSYWSQMMAYYSALRTLGVDVDVIHADADLSAYSLVVAPAITLVSAARAKHWAEASAKGISFVFGPRTAFRTQNGDTWSDGQFGPLSNLLGAKLLQYDSLRPTLSQTVTGISGEFKAQHWAESYRIIETAEEPDSEVLYFYSGGALDGQAAVIKRGHNIVIGAHSERLISTVLQAALSEANIGMVHLPEGIRISRRADKVLIQNWNTHPVHWNGYDLQPVSFEVINDPTINQAASILGR